VTTSHLLTSHTRAVFSHLVLWLYLGHTEAATVTWREAKQLELVDNLLFQ
jgi:hypothetical protein